LRERDSAVSSSLGKVDAAAVVHGGPVRPFPSLSRGQRNYPGWLWTATTRSLVGLFRPRRRAGHGKDGVRVMPSLAGSSGQT
jgi:hypothetical protein